MSQFVKYYSNVALILVLSIMVSSFSFGEMTAHTYPTSDQLSMGAGQTAVLKSDGSLWMWGRNDLGQIGNGKTENVLKPIKIMDQVSKVYTYKFTTAALKNDGSLWVWGDNYPLKLGNGLNTEILKPIKILEDVEQFCIGDCTGAAIKTDGNLWMWGSNKFGQLGTGDNKGHTVPIKVLDDVKSIALTTSRTAAVKKDESLWMWGEGQYIPSKVEDQVAMVALDSTVTAILKTDGTLLMQGSSDFGQLGAGEVKNTYAETGAAKTIKIMDQVARIDLYDRGCAALKKDGSLWTWGSNYSEQLGVGTRSKDGLVNKPIKIMEGVTRVYRGDTHMGALKKDGSLWLWGQNLNSQIGSGKLGEIVPYYNAPVKILDNVKTASLSFSNAAAIKKDGSLWIWGDNFFDQMGYLNVSYVPKPYNFMSINVPKKTSK